MGTVWIVLLSTLFVIGYLLLGRRDLIGDEWAHFQQAKDLIALIKTGAEFTPVHPAIPGYHLILAIAGWITGSDGLFFFRAISAVLSFFTVIAFYATARRVSGRSMVLLRTAQFLFLPILFPFAFLLYTDVPSLLPLLLCLYAIEARRYHLACIAALLTIGIRQNNAVWIGMFLLLIVIREWKGFSLHALRRLGGAIAGLLLALSALVLFILINGGVALADEGAHPLSFHTGNVVVLCFVLVVMMAPVFLLQPVAFVRSLAPYVQWIVPGGVLLLFFFLLTFRNDHGYNFDPWWLRNKLLILMTSSAWHTTAYFFFVMIPAVCIALHTRFSRKFYYLLYPFTILYLGASWLVEPRYFFVPITLFLLLRKMERRSVELGVLLLFVVLAGVLFEGARRGAFLP